ncbi:efflux RND transporter periplasmic adaptor subunit [Gimesia chilikensis]|uniref:efflux RND transporter periplasmic adaptor subunit n=1 Tax=Gimesia chilikensis TaxID=2605989 RepID=UPI00118B019D|nr:efflux RND transporter periplasmic adaptor subunit [Gimesia chilikensis]QDT86461.1 Multidrug resistance protein MdtE precursor [Gimesia chilikensis]
MKSTMTVASFLALISLSLTGCEYLPQTHAESHTAAPGKAHGEEHAEGHADEHGGAHAESHGEGHGEGGHHAIHKIIVTAPVKKDVISTQQYVCQIHSCQHIEVRALEGGYLEKINIKEGQHVKKGDLLFKILPTLFQARMESELAEANRVQIELDNAQSLMDKGIVSSQEIALKKAELAKAKAKVQLAQAELGFTNVKAPFDGIVDRQRNQLGSLIEEGDVLTTMSDNSLMWVYFNVPEAQYLEYKAELDKDGGKSDHLQIELKLANGEIFPQEGKIGAIEADFNNMTGNIPFRADFSNPERLLRNGQTGTILIHRTLQNLLVIPQRATFEILAKRYAFVVDKDNVVHQRDIEIKGEQDDIFVLKSGLKEGEKIILEGIRQVKDGDKIKYDFRDPKEVLSNLKYHAE